MAKQKAKKKLPSIAKRRKRCKKMLESAIEEIEALGFAIYPTVKNTPLWEGYKLVNDPDLESNYQSQASGESPILPPPDPPPYKLVKR